MLPILTELVPCLKPHPTAWLTHNVLSATSIYKHAAHYSHEHILLWPGPVTAALLGAESPWGCLWGHDIFWRRTLTETTDRGFASARMRFDGQVTPAKLCAWLRALAARIALPTPRPYQVTAHQYPNALPTWWRLVEVLAARVPPHWLQQAVRPLLTDSMRCCIAVANATDCVNEPSLKPVGRWVTAVASTSAWDLGAVSAEMDVLAALSVPRLPYALLARSVEEAEAACAGGAPLLFELPVGERQAMLMFGTNATAQWHKLGVVLLHPEEQQRLAGSKGDPTVDSQLRQFGLPALSALTGSLGDGSTLRRVAQLRGSPACGGTRMQVLSAARWVTRTRRTNAQGSSSASQVDERDPAGSEWGQDGKRRAALQFWVREQRLQAMLREGWAAHTVTTDTWLVTTKVAAPLRKGSIVRRV